MSRLTGKSILTALLAFFAIFGTTAETKAQDYTVESISRRFRKTVDHRTVVSPNGHFVAISDGRRVLLYNTASQKTQRFSNLPKHIIPLAINNSGELLARTFSAKISSKLLPVGTTRRDRYGSCDVRVFSENGSSRLIHSGTARRDECLYEWSPAYWDESGRGVIRVTDIQSREEGQIQLLLYFDGVQTETLHEEAQLELDTALLDIVFTEQGVVYFTLAIFGGNNSSPDQIWRFAPEDGLQQIVYSPEITAVSVYPSLRGVGNNSTLLVQADMKFFAWQPDGANGGTVVETVDHSAYLRGSIGAIDSQGHQEHILYKGSGPKKMGKSVKWNVQIQRGLENKFTEHSVSSSSRKLGRSDLFLVHYLEDGRIIAELDRSTSKFDRVMTVILNPQN